MRGQYKAYKSIEDNTGSIEDNQEIGSNSTEYKPLSLYTFIRLVALIIISITLLSLSVNMINHQPYEDNNNTNSTATLKSINDNNLINIALLGDSLIGVPWDRYDLKGKLTEQISGNVNLCSYGVGGSKIDDILKRVDSVLTECKPQYVILFWDSDCSDINESVMTSEQITELRNKYKDNVLEVCSRILKFGAGLAVAGPELLGEGQIMIGIPPRFYNKVCKIISVSLPLPSLLSLPLLPSFTIIITDYYHKTGMLEAYKKMNQEVASSISAPYIDVREAFLDATKYWPLGLGLVTRDGILTNTININTSLTLTLIKVNILMIEELKSLLICLVTKLMIGQTLIIKRREVRGQQLC